MEMRKIPLSASSFSLAGCNRSGYREPGISMPAAYTEDRIGQTTPVEDEDLLHWWGAFNDPFLDELLEETIERNFDLIIALEQVYQARSQYWVQFTQILPEFDFDAQGSRYRTSQAFKSALTPTTAAAGAAPLTGGATTTISPVQNFFQLGFDAIWQIDLFGELPKRCPGIL